jgi:transcriptional regulator with XRE-family HTH domain
MWSAEQLRARIREQGRTREWVAQRAGIKVETLTHILNGRKPSLPVIKLLAITLGCDESDIDPALAAPVSLKRTGDD